MSYPNKRGSASRHVDKKIRVATHKPVLVDCINTMSASLHDPIFILEHGMGISSTPYFHTIEFVSKIVSLETEPSWLYCNDCKAGSTTPHELILINDINVVEHVTKSITNPSRTIALVDGNGTQRLPVLIALMGLDVALIVEHDAEMFNASELAQRKAYAKSFGYNAFQYVNLHPETAIYMLKFGIGISMSGSNSYVEL